MDTPEDDDDLAVGRIKLQGDWDLNMIGEVTRLYLQLYSAGGFLLRPEGNKDFRPVVNEAAFSALMKAADGNTDPYASHTPGRFNYPWRGGYSAVAFFRTLYVALPPRYRPEVLEIQYASPGFMDILGFAGALSLIVGMVAKNAGRILAVYNQGQDTLRAERMNKLDVRERQAKVQLIEKFCERLTAAMELPPMAHGRLQAVTPNDQWARLKLVMSIARRVGKVAGFQASGMVTLEEPRPVSKELAKNPPPEKVRKIATAKQMPANDLTDYALLKMMGFLDDDEPDDTPSPPTRTKRRKKGRK